MQKLQLVCEWIRAFTDLATEDAEELATTVPFASLAYYRGQDREAVASVVSAATVWNPMVADLRFATESGEEPPYVTMSPTLQATDSAAWHDVYCGWASLLVRLFSDDTELFIRAPVVDQAFLASGVDCEVSQLPQPEPALPVLVNAGALARQASLLGMKAPLWRFLWDYESVGYLVRRHNIPGFAMAATVTRPSHDAAVAFFESLRAVFVIKHELAGMWLASPRLDARWIAEELHASAQPARQ